MTTTIYLIRHGQTQSNVDGYHMGWSDEDLNATGYAQAGILAGRLAEVPFASVYTSSSKRAFTTAAIIARPHGIAPKPMTEFREINYGDWAGQKRNEMREKYPDIAHRLRVDPLDVVIPGGESFKQVAERAMRGFDAIIAAEKDRCVAIVSHSVPLKILVANILGVPHSMWERFGMGNTSISTVQISDGIPRLLNLNDMTHLDGRAPV
ncbi:MAG: histidine phosphatase family protein [Chloroflexota bacterium]